ncbi:MAG TPA: hypothetical protein VMQ40_03755 [Acidimicrobiales bacterium]|jgi:hypothetical protein|nr:hypothetical protein [Acidimicrobiales bacterium]
MAEISRRSFLIKGSAGAAALGALTVVPGLEGRAGATESTPKLAHHPAPVATTTDSRASSDSLVVHIPNPRTGEIHYLVGTREIVHKDKALVARLLRDAS